MISVLAGFGVRFLRNSSFSRLLHLTSSAMKNHLPDRWTEYSAVGKRIPGTRFIAFKVPLQKIFDRKLATGQRFSPTNLIIEIKKQNEELGLVVDLTCTKRYYTPMEFPAMVQYAKIFTAGKKVPSDDVIHEFKSIVKQFLSENPDNDKLIGVHCTHGLNRTGYLVCRYMIDVLGMVPSEAIEIFNKSRGHCIERQNYLDDLLQGKPRNWEPRVSAPSFSQLPGQYIPGPQYGFQQMGERPPGFPFASHGPRLPPPGFPHPHIPGHHTPHTEENQQQHFRGRPGRHRHYPKRYFAQQPDDRPMNGAPGWDPAPHIPQKYGDCSVNGTDSHGVRPQGHGCNGPYSRWPRQGRRGRQWQ